MALTPEQAMAAIEHRFGRHAGHRALHAKGQFCEGTFTATDEGAELCRAPHMRGEPVAALVRFSNAAGNPRQPDYAPDIRGLAVGFELPGGERTDVLAQTERHFPFPGPEGFVALLRASKPAPASLVRLPLVLLRHPKAARRLPGSLRSIASLPASFAARSYYAIHAFRWIAPDGSARWVRYTWRATVPEASLSSAEARKRGRDYLFDELRERLAREPIRMRLEVQVAEAGDEPDDPSAEWPAERRRVDAGTLEVHDLSDHDDATVMDPMRLCDGIEPSGDPVLRFRPSVYSLSYERRSAG